MVDVDRSSDDGSGGWAGWEGGRRKEGQGAGRRKGVGGELEELEFRAARPGTVLRAQADRQTDGQTDRRAHPREGVVETRATVRVCLGQDHWDRGKIAIALGWARLADWRCRREARWPWLEVDLRPARCVGPVDQIMTLGGGTRASRRGSVSLGRRAAASLCLATVSPWLAGALLLCACVLVGSWSGRQPGLREHRGCRDAVRCGAVRCGALGAGVAMLPCAAPSLCLRFGVGQHRALAGTGRTGKGWARIPRSGQPPKIAPTPTPGTPIPSPAWESLSSAPLGPLLCSHGSPQELLVRCRARYQVPGARCYRRHHVARPVSGVFSFPSNQQLSLSLSTCLTYTHTHTHRQNISTSTTSTTSAPCQLTSAGFKFKYIVVLCIHADMLSIGA